MLANSSLAEMGIARSYFLSLDVWPVLEASALFYMCFNTQEIG